ncbi:MULTISPECIES: hypothetical protein [Fibrobacter]|uniref:hypothetical protein n=1 Tax=Fibrobacter TaxID=832 RepID=UPI00156562E8|nr:MULTISPECIES: hypothetical protein [Fibrobacter]MBR4784506.1 hypothetical protein [Fibrobacter sp.]
MRVLVRNIFAVTVVACAAVFTGCTTHPSPQQTMVDDRYLMYKETYKAYKEAEERYLNLLFNIERMPEEEELWIMKREQMQELMQLRELMLQARGELDDAMKTWEKHLMDVQAEVKKAQVQQSSPNFRGRDAQRTSPGQLLPGEVPNTRR